MVEQNRGWSVLRIGEQREMGTWGWGGVGVGGCLWGMGGGGKVDRRS